MRGTESGDAATAVVRKSSAEGNSDSVLQPTGDGVVRRAPARVSARVVGDGENEADSDGDEGRREGGAEVGEVCGVGQVN